MLSYSSKKQRDAQIERQILAARIREAQVSKVVTAKPKRSLNEAAHKLYRS
jgi:hypothetical protein